MIENLKNAEKEIRTARSEVINRLICFAPYDVVFFWSKNAGLQKQQLEKWAPILKWINQELYTDFKTTLDLETPNQNITQAEVLKKRLEQFSDQQLTAFYAAALDLRSVVLAFALVMKHISAAEAFDLSEMEELYQQKQWGTDEIAKTRQDALLSRLKAIESYLD